MTLLSGCENPNRIGTAPPGASLTKEEAALFQCPDPPVLADGAEEYEDVLGTALSLRSALDWCRDLNERLIGLATSVAK